MWVITIYHENEIVMYEYEDEKQAKEKFSSLSGNKYLTKLIYL